MLISPLLFPHGDMSAAPFRRNIIGKNRIIELMPRPSPVIVLVLNGLARIDAPTLGRIVPAGHAIVAKAADLVRITALSPCNLVLTDAGDIVAAADDLLPVSPALAAILDCDYPTFETRYGQPLLIEDLRRSTPVRCGVRMPSDPRAVRVAQAILDDPADPRSLNSFADQAGASRRTLLRLFVAETGMSFRQFRRHARICCALTRLAAGEAIQDVALAVGYESTAAFIAAFKALTGKTPGSMRRKTRSTAAGESRPHP